MDKIKKYNDRFYATTKRNSHYGLKFDETIPILKKICCAIDANGALEIIVILFNYGYAKGYRACQSEMKKVRQEG